MFAAYCENHQTEVLLSAGRIDKVVNTDAGIELHWTCWCGHHGTILTGRRRRPAA